MKTFSRYFLCAIFSENWTGTTKTSQQQISKHFHHNLRKFLNGIRLCNIISASVALHFNLHSNWNIHQIHCTITCNPQHIFAWLTHNAIGFSFCLTCCFKQWKCKRKTASKGFHSKKKNHTTKGISKFFLCTHTHPDAHRCKIVRIVFHFLLCWHRSNDYTFSDQKTCYILFVFPFFHFCTSAWKELYRLSFSFTCTWNRDD